MAKPAEKISPLHELASPRIPQGHSGVQLSERLCDSLVQVQAWPKTAKQIEKIIRERADKAVVIMPTGPGRWLVEDESDDLEERLRSKISPEKGAVTGLTHARVVVSINGPKAEWVLSGGIALDFCEAAFPVGTTQVSHHHEIGVTIHRTGAQSFDLYVFSSLARGFWHWIERAGEEVGLTVG